MVKRKERRPEKGQTIGKEHRKGGTDEKRGGGQKEIKREKIRIWGEQSDGRGGTGDERKDEGGVKEKREERQPRGALWRIVHQLM